MKKENPEQGLLKAKKHFEILDGLRGVAALAVVIFHFMEWVFSDFNKNFIAHGFLAVDFFFCLSGFVIGYAYDNRIVKLGPLAFFTSRLIRLHPLVILGSVLGLLVFLFDPFALPPPAYNTGKLLLLFLGSLFMIPMPLMEERVFNQFGFNAPAWSLFWEYVANIVYALVLYRLGRRSLGLLVAVAAVILCYVSYRAGNLTGGWGKGNFWDGGARVAYSFLMGLLVYRSNWIIKNKLGFGGLAVLLSLAFVMPWTQWNWLTEFLVVVIYFPLLVSLGAGASIAPGIKKFCRFSGDISYPLYMTHYAGIWIFAHYFTLKKPGMEQLSYLIPFGVLFLVGFGYLAMVFYDLPVRNYLTAKRKGERIAANVPS